MILAARFFRKSTAWGFPWPGVVRFVRNAPHSVYLTFDDGPFAGSTERVLDLLAQHQAQATFFVTGQQVERHPELTRRIRREGHRLGNHTYSHCHLTELSANAAMADVERCQQLIAPQGAPRLFRPTHGLLGPAVYWRLRRAGYAIAYWSLDSRDSWEIPAPTLAQAILRRIRPGEIVLLHDDRANGIAALELLLPQLSQRGLRCEQLGRPGS